MLAIAQAKPALSNGAPIDYHEARAEQLPVAAADFDVAVCHHGLQFFSNREAALVEMRRALRAGGRVGIAVWAEIEQAPPFAALADAVRELAGDELADRYRAGPWGMPDADQLRELLEDSGFHDVRVMRRTLPLTFECAAQLASTLAASAIAADLDALTPPQREELAHALERRTAVDDALRGKAVANLALACVHRPRQ